MEDGFALDIHRRKSKVYLAFALGSRWTSYGGFTRSVDNCFGRVVTQKFTHRLDSGHLLSPDSDFTWQFHSGNQFGLV